MKAEFVSLRVDDSEMKAYRSVPDGSGPFPAVVLAQHASGVDEFMQFACETLSKAGFAAIAPDLYHRQEKDITFEEIIAIKRGDPRRDEVIPAKMGGLRDDEMVRDMNAAIAYLQSLDEVSDKTGVTGFCMGGRVAYLMATRNAKLRAASCFYPGGPFESKGGGPSPFAASDRINCPVQAFSGGDDVNPSPADMARIDSELNRLRVPHEFHTYDGAAHAFMDHTNTGAYRESASKDAWVRLVEFFDRNLRG